MPQPENQQPNPTVPTENRPRRPLAGQPWWQELVHGAIAAASTAVATSLLQWAQHLL